MNSVEISTQKPTTVLSRVTKPISTWARPIDIPTILEPMQSLISPLYIMNLETSHLFTTIG